MALSIAFEARQLQGQVAQALLRQQVEIAELTEEWKHLDIPFTEKYTTINTYEMIQLNAKNPEWTSKLIASLNTLSKYGRNLLKPAEERPTNWRIIKYSNTVFRSKVQNIMGSVNIIKKLGYCIETVQGLSIPEGAEPDRGYISMITAAILLTIAELEDWVKGVHPHGKRIQECISQSAQAKEDSLPIVRMPNMNVEATMASEAMPHQPGLTSPLLYQPGLDGKDQLESVSTYVSGQELVCAICKKPALMMCHTCAGMTFCIDCHQKIDGSARHNHIVFNKEIDLETNITRKRESDEEISFPVNNTIQQVSQPTEYPNNWTQSTTSGVTETTSVDVNDIIAIKDQNIRKSVIDDQLKKLQSKYDVIESHIQQIIIKYDDFFEHPRYGPLADKKMAIEADIKVLQKLLNEYERPPGSPHVVTMPTMENVGNHIPFEASQVYMNESKPISGCEETASKAYALPSFQFASNTSAVCLKSQNSNLPFGCSTPIVPQEDGLPQPAKASSNSIETVWQCKYCDFVNGKEANICEYCNEGIKEFGMIPNETQHSPGFTTSTDVYDQRSEAWSCEYCTTINSADSNICSICGKTRRTNKQSDSWQCTACTFINDPTSLACLMCGSPLQKTKESKSMWACPKCTYENPYSTAICEVCKIKNNLIVVKQPREEPVQVAEKSSGNTQAVNETLNVVQNQCQLPLSLLNSKSPKPAAVENCEFNQDSDTSSMYESAEEGKESSPDPEEKRNLNACKDLNQSQNNLKSALHQSEGNLDENKAKIKSLRLQYPLTVRKESVKDKTEQNGCDAEIESNLSLPEKEKFHMQKQIDFPESQKELKMLFKDGTQMTKLMREADDQGFDGRELQIAMDMCSEDNPVRWLTEHFLDHLKNLAEKASELAAEDTGRISVAEAVDSLKDTDSDMEQAAQICVKNRKDKIEEVMSYGNFEKENVTEALYENEGDVEAAIMELTQYQFNPLLENIWQGQPNVEEDPLDESLTEFVPRHNELTDEIFVRNISNKEFPLGRRARLALLEGGLQGWMRAENVITLIDTAEIMESGITVMDVIEAVKSRGDIDQAKEMLLKECLLCFTIFPLHKLHNLTTCACCMCEECFAAYYEHQIKEKTVADLCCPVCQVPDISDVGVADGFFQFLDIQLQRLMERDVYLLFEQKLRDWNLQHDPNFVWCAHCENGFIAHAINNRKAQCMHCQNYMCWQCKIPWEEEHADITCEAFRVWKETNAGEQTIIQQLDREREGIVCPKCNTRYALAKGGCIHFVCRQCKFEFCCGCSKPFVRGTECQVGHERCRGKGLHCHHPRDCLNYMRDYDVKELQEILQKSNIEFDTEVPDDHRTTCPIMEQKELEEGKRYIDEPCGVDIERHYAGLCGKHYKEYLVQRINEHKLDPVIIMNTNNLTTLLNREEVQFEEQRRNESSMEYKTRLRDLIQQQIPI